MIYDTQDRWVLLSYDDALKKGISVVGGKAYSLAWMHSQGFLVPKGLILSKDTIIQDWAALSSEVSQRLGEGLYIVRSSAIGEDSLQYSWAGCFDSIPEVRLNYLHSAIEQCKKSVYGQRAKYYADLHRISSITEMAVLIQKYIVAEYSGVGFSINPVSEDPKEIIIEYQSGKSGGIVGGKGVASVNTFYKNNIVSRKEEPSWMLNVATTVFQIEKIFEKAVDVEWIWKDGKIYVTQARPITTL